MAVDQSLHKVQLAVPRNLAAGAVMVGACAIVVAAVLWLQEFTPPVFLMFSLFVYPLPIGWGIAAGAVAPRGSIAWGPVWVCVAMAAVYALLYGTIARAGSGGIASGLSVAGAGLAALAAVEGRLLAQRGRIRWAATGIALTCLVMLPVLHGLVRHSEVRFQRDVMPEVLLALEQDYLTVPKGTQWVCRGRPALASYELSTMLHGARLCVLSDTRSPRILGVSYSLAGSKRRLARDDAALSYLRSLGFQRKLLGALVRERMSPPSWRAGLETTELVLRCDGGLALRPPQACQTDDGRLRIRGLPTQARRAASDRLIPRVPIDKSPLKGPRRPIGTR